MHPVTRLKAACYTTNVTMSVVGNLSPILFLTFRSLYDLSYSLLGLLVLINFVTQLTVDLLFSLFSHKFNLPLTVKITPVIAVIGLFIYAICPLLFPTHAYLGLAAGTIIFSAASGLAEVLISPVIAALPAKDPDREMSKLHSIYAWGVVAVIMISTLFLHVFGKTHWPVLALLFTLIPISSALLFAGAEIPVMQTPARTAGALSFFQNKKLWLCFTAIFLGGAAECTMAQWGSGYLEQTLSIPKVWGDLLGMALFALMMGVGRTLYAQKGKNIRTILLFSAIGAFVCYVIAALCRQPIVVLPTLAFTGLCCAMLWPGSLVVAEQLFPKGGVFIFAIMAAGGDLGASIGPQLVGVITDGIAASPAAASFAQSLSLSPEQLGMRAAILVGSLFPLIAIAVFARFCHNAKKEK